MRGGKRDVLKVIALVAVTTGVMLWSPGSAAALQGTICGDYTLPKDAQLSQLGTALDASGNKIIIIEYYVAGASSVIKIPFDTIGVTCTDLRVRAAVLNMQEFAVEVRQASCKFVGDLLAGRVQLPPDKAAHYDRKFAEEWYRKTCLGTK